MNSIQAWMWATAVLTKRMVEVGVDQSHLASKYATEMGNMSIERQRYGATVIKEMVATLSDEEIASYTTSVAQRDILAGLFEAS